jgi:hypothetical protein
LQVGEGLAFLGHNFGIERLPARPQHLTPLDAARASISLRVPPVTTWRHDAPGDPRMSYLTGWTLAPVLVDTEIESGWMR